MLPQALGLAQQLPAVGAGVSLESGLEIAGDVYLALTDVNRGRDAGLLECVLAALAAGRPAATHMRGGTSPCNARSTQCPSWTASLPSRAPAPDQAETTWGMGPTIQTTTCRRPNGSHAAQDCCTCSLPSSACSRGPSPPISSWLGTAWPPQTKSRRLLPYLV